MTQADSALNEENTMKAMVHDEYGPPSVLGLKEIDTPRPKDDEVLIRVRAAGVNWADWSMVRGMPYIMRLGYGLRKPRKGLRGTDVAGEVEAIGADVTNVKPGDQVFGWCTGAFAEYVCTGEGSVVLMPPSLTFEQAAAVPMAGMVALQALRNVGKVQRGQKVLVVGASGGIGSFAVQIARSIGAEVTGVCSTNNMELVRSIGAEHVIDYTRDDFTQGDQRYDLILDIADKQSLSVRRRVLVPKGTLIPNSGHGGPWFGSVGRIFRAWMVSPFVGHRLHPFLSLPKQEDLVALVELIESGDVTPIVDRTYPLIEAGEAVAYVGAGHARGKTVINV
ncbi:MAG: NAD(P)-dependent alcohol dehydrogenase [Acidimicrobiia bacterium]|nr:NAD(P)-dependent alcohol dehydrogenase [Acidimicrobiia bacterium]